MRKLFVVLSLIIVTACTGTTPPASFYSLKPVETSSAPFTDNIRKKTTIGVSEVSVPGYLDRPQIVTSSANGVEQNISEFNRWSEPLSSMLQRTLAQDLAAYLPHDLVKPRLSGRENFDYTIQVEISRFDATWHKQAVLEAWWNIKNKDNKIVSRNQADLKLPLGTGYDELVAVQSKLVEELAQNIASEIRKLK